MQTGLGLDLLRWEGCSLLRSPHLTAFSSPLLPVAGPDLNIEPVLGRGNIATEREGQSVRLAACQLTN